MIAVRASWTKLLNATKLTRGRTKCGGSAARSNCSAWTLPAGL
nr:MAG TPA: hypothetical protein [Caudoviricetes sp.]